MKTACLAEVRFANCHLKCALLSELIPIVILLLYPRLVGVQGFSALINILDSLVPGSPLARLG
jgi:hypothetical protein